ncbi:disease resistance protein RPP13-like [Salvia miltiorrhiza]|uniref:disease resistance protein RPP13-like n=1 Tax=Salvia miltiorrhiza TaxID=226208 RepID=UPI0025AD92B7|nr:disease resistance protein RPP13-like [Salvia miltiorrhiza]
MAEAIVLSAVEKLENLLVIEEGVSKHRKTAKQEKEELVVVVEGLRDDLRGMLSLFTNNSTKESGDYISRVTEIAHDVDVAIDNYILQDTQPKSAFFKFFKPSSGQVMNTFHGMRICLQVLWSEFSRSEEAGPTSRRIPPAVEVEVGVVEGMKEDVELVLRKAIFLEESAQGLATSCIVGMGGVGKTTLAQMLYTHERVASEFEIRAWVYVSTEFTSKQVLKELILQFGVNYDEVDAHEPSRLRDMVFQHLHTRRYFIILDHVWRDQDLDFVFTAFPHNEKASRLLVTSRIRDIIGHAQYIHERRTLDHIQSWRLFLKTVFGEYNKCPNHLVEIGRKIVTRCDGLPLAIMEAGGKLSVKEQSESEWASFLESMDLSSTSEILELSYHKMRSPIMKSCFLHVGSFMEGTTIRVQKLVQLWTAGGILDVSRGKEKSKTDEEIGIFFIAELINECIFEVKGRSKTDYRVKYCYINRNLHRLAVAKATEEIRFEVRKSDDLTSKKSRHCVICCSRDKFNYRRDHDKHLISLVFRGGGSLDRLSWLSRLKLLKILDFEASTVVGEVGKA